MKREAFEQPAAAPAPAPSPRLRLLSGLLADAGITLDGDAPCDLQMRNPRLAERVFAYGSLGLGEAYMDGDWDAGRLDEFFARLLRARLDTRVKPASLLMHAFSARLLNRQTPRRAWQVGERHYDLGNDFYAAMLDPRMTYTCGYWQDAADLASAQEAKLELICRKLDLRPGMHLLDIGCGWGSLLGYAAEHHGVRGTGVTVSREQAEWAQQRYAGLPVEFRLQDYRELDGHETFDRVASVGMFEHVGRRNFRTFMQVVRRALAPDGLALLHTIGKNTRRGVTDPWIDRYIFPNGELPSIGQIGDAVDDVFVVEDLHNFGADYDRTLMAWHANFEAAWPQFADRLGERFRRMWRYYLLSCAGAFRARDIQLWQWVLSPRGVAGGYRSAR